jgi:hypothetical protein
MVDTLQNEGFPINDRELIRLRLRLKLLLRESVPRPKRKRTAGGKFQGKTKKKPPKTVPGNGLTDQLANAILAEEYSSEESEEDVDKEAGEDILPTASEDTVQLQHGVNGEPLDPEEALRKQLRQEQLRSESDEKWRTRKRRRRTRGWAGLPADAPGEPPRFPSETTIDEAKAYLGLDNDMYRDVRERFLQICKAQDIIKKTVAGPERWADVVRQLINEHDHLSTVFQQELDVLTNIDALFRPKGQRALSLDVICMDVTKRLRTMESRMTLADAKNMLVLNPEHTRRVRAAFAAKLKTDHFTNKHEAGEQHWADLKTAWVNESELLVRALAQGEADPDYARKLRAIEVLARDVMKRQQQEKTAKDPNKKKQVHQGPGPGPAPPAVAPPTRSKSQSETQNAEQTVSHANFDTMAALASAADLQIDPSLLLAASDAAIPYQPYAYHDHQNSAASYRPAQHTAYTPTPTYYPPQQSTSSSSPLPIYFRLHPHSSTPFPAKTVWLSILQSLSIAEIRALAAREHPGCAVLRLEGFISYRGEQGDKEVSVEVGDDAELGAYLGHVGKGKATFVVLLGGMGVSGGAGGGYV